MPSNYGTQVNFPSTNNALASKPKPRHLEHVIDKRFRSDRHYRGTIISNHPRSKLSRICSGVAKDVHTESSGEIGAFAEPD